MLKNMFHLHCISEEMKCSNDEKHHQDDRMVVIFYKFAYSNLNHHKITRVEKGKQTKTAQFEHCDDRMLLVFTHTRT